MSTKRIYRIIVKDQNNTIKDIIEFSRPYPAISSAVFQKMIDKYLNCYPNDQINIMRVVK